MLKSSLCPVAVFTGRCSIWTDSSSDFIPLSLVTGRYNLLHGVSGCYMVLHGVTACYSVLHSVTRRYRVLHGVTGC